MKIIRRGVQCSRIASISRSDRRALTIAGHAPGSDSANNSVITVDALASSTTESFQLCFI
ncbi:hypothetical protein [Paraburkholderia sp. RAU2J]|uniref:hypothetical protein n=1 Tax=Paraburkholderia sp. RAU2J TaxID=1938810 RepID=UPI00131553D9|nr:hypothetical protein [Paraburkholderia sp. RAU2J]